MNLKRYFFLASAGLLVSLSSLATPLTPDEALARIGKNLQTRAGLEKPVLVMTKNTEAGVPSVYVFDYKNSDGYIIVSADDCVTPLLGYSDYGNFDPSSISPQLEWWLGEYSRQIEYTLEKGLKFNPDFSTRSTRKSIEPLCKTRWNQHAPFSDQCPEIGGSRPPSGCVATAMAQVMKYWNYPEKGEGTGEITLPGTDKTDEMSFDQKNFDWKNMINSYEGAYTQVQGEAVAYLLKACGYSVNMNYSLGGSGAITLRAALALINNFKYNKNIMYLDRDVYPYTEWEEILYNELAEKRPVLYGGASTSVGHEFICDGYSADGYFHFNWGWGGMSDGYFLLDALNPNSVGAGGGDGGGYNFGQDIIIGIQPETTDKAPYMITQMGNLQGIQSGNNLVLSLSDSGWWVNKQVSAIDINLGVCIEVVNKPEVEKKYFVFGSGEVGGVRLIKSENGTRVNYYGWRGEDIVLSMPENIGSDTYKYTIVCKPNQEDNNNWTPVLVDSDCYNYVLVRKVGMMVSVESMPLAEPKIDESSLLSDLYFNAYTRLSITVSNNSEKEITRAFYPQLYSDNALMMEGEGIVVTIPPHSTVTRDFATIFDLADGGKGPGVPTEYTLRYYDPSRSYGEDYLYPWEGKATMQVYPGNLDLSVSDFIMPDLDFKVENTIMGISRVYQAYNINDIPFSCKVTNNADFFGYPVSVLIFNGDLKGYNIASLNVGPTPVLSRGQSAVVSGSFDFTGAEANALYAGLVYVYRDGWNQMGMPIFFRVMASGVDSIENDEDSLSITYDKGTQTVNITSGNSLSNVAVYGLDGSVKTVDTTISGNEAQLSLYSLPSGIWIVTAADESGAKTSLKVVK